MSVKYKINLNKVNKSLIICGFPGVGKSFLTKENPNSVSDSDSSTFDKKNFPANYIKHIKGLIGKKSIIMISTHEEVIDEMEKLNVNFIIVHPARELKDEYLKRYEERGSPEGFIKLLSDKWDEFQDAIEKPRDNSWKLILQKGEFLSDYFEKYNKLSGLVLPFLSILYQPKCLFQITSSNYLCI